MSSRETMSVSCPVALSGQLSLVIVTVTVTVHAAGSTGLGAPAQKEFHLLEPTRRRHHAQVHSKDAPADEPNKMGPIHGNGAIAVHVAHAKTIAAKL